MADRLVLEGTEWANLRFVTPLDIALRMGAPFLVERGVDPSEEGLGPALIMRLLLGLPAGPSYFRPLANQPAMAHALSSTIRELRMAGIKAKDVAPGAAFVNLVFIAEEAVDYKKATGEEGWRRIRTTQRSKRHVASTRRL